ncbi:hypothetical protein BDV3_002309 [Batrachochytrium dendrobatidis]
MPSKEVQVCFPVLIHLTWKLKSSSDNVGNLLSHLQGRHHEMSLRKIMMERERAVKHAQQVYQSELQVI